MPDNDTSSRTVYPPDSLAASAPSAPVLLHTRALDERNAAWEGRCLTLLGSFLLMFNSWGLVNSFGTFLSFYQETLMPSSTSLLKLNLIGSMQTFVVLGSSFVVGRLVDARYVRQVLIVGTVCVSLGLFSLSFVERKGREGDGRWGITLFVQGIVVGLGMGCFFVTSSAVVSTWFQKRKGFAIGIVATGASIAGLVYPIMLRFLIDSSGFVVAIRWISLLTLLTCVLACFLARPNPNSPVRRPSSWCKLSVWIDSTAFKSLPFILFSAAISMMLLGFYGVFFNLEEWAAQTRVGFRGAAPPPCTADDSNLEGACATPALRTYWLLAMMNGSSSLGRLSSSYLCDKFGALNVHAFVTFIAALLCLILWTCAKKLAAAIVFVILFGAFSGSVIGLPPASMAFILGPSEDGQARLGQWTGMMYSIAAPFALTGPLIEGYIIQRYGYNFVTIQCFSGACFLMSALLMASARLLSNHRRAERLGESVRGSMEKSISGISSRASSLFRRNNDLSS